MRLDLLGGKNARVGTEGKKEEVSSLRGLSTSQGFFSILDYSRGGMPLVTPSYPRFASIALLKRDLWVSPQPR